MMATRKQTDAETWEAMEAAAALDDLDEIAAMSRDEVDRELREGGIDPDALRARGKAQITALRARHVRLGWQMAGNAKLEHVRALESQVKGRYAKVPRAELEAHLAAAQRNPRFAGQVSAMFRKRASETSSDDDLRELLESLDVLAALQQGDGGDAK